MFMGHSYGVLMTINLLNIAWSKTIRRIWRLDKKKHNV